MKISPDNVYHIYNQGNNRQTIFFNRKDYLVFLTLYKRFFTKYCNTLAWCLMPNHFHFMVLADERSAVKLKQGGIYLDPVSNSIRKLLSGYARIFNDQYRQSGSLFRQKTKSKCISAVPTKMGGATYIHDYSVNCFHYIHQNPLHAGLVAKLEDWEFSSFRDYASLRNGILCNKELATVHCGYQPDHFIEDSYKMIEERIVKLFT